MISVVILTKNEEKNIKDCIESVSFANEVIVIDDNSSDKTLEIAKKLGANIFIHPLNNDFSSQRNFGLSQAKNNWVLFVDADEKVSDVLASEISNIQYQISNDVNGFYIKRKDFMWGKELKHGESGDIRFVRLGKKDSGKWEGAVHEEWKIKGRVQELKNPILHYPHQSVKEFLEKINFYTDIRANELFTQGKKVNFFSIILYPKAKFLQNYFLKLGFLDGVEGLILALCMSLHSFLVRGKLWQLLNNEK